MPNFVFINPINHTNPPKMLKSIVKSSFVFASAIALFSFTLPSNWFKAGSSPKSYEMGLVKGLGSNGSNAATIKSIDKNIKGFGTLMQECKADKFLGKRVKMTALVKSENVKRWAGLWLRVDQARSQQPLAMDNMFNRPIKGNTDWKSYEIVLDIPANATQLAYGALLHGTGQIWFDQVQFEIVPNTTSTTNTTANPVNQEPVNLGFDE